MIGLIASFHTIIYAYGRQIYSLARAGYYLPFMSLTSASKVPHMALFAGILQDELPEGDERRRRRDVEVGVGDLLLERRGASALAEAQDDATIVAGIQEGRVAHDNIRNLVFLLDVSGSMSPYADALLRLRVASRRVGASAMGRGY